MADNTRKTSNLLHEVAEVKEDVSNNSQNIQDNTDAIGNISIPSVGDGEINLEAGDGLTLSAGNENAKANQDGDTTFKIEANLTYLNDNLNIPVGGVSKIIAGDNVTISPTNGTGDVTINAAGGGTGGIPEAPINGKQYGREDGNWTEVTSATPVVPGDGNITLKSTDGSVSVTGDNATANQTTDTAWDLSVNIPTPATPGDGKIDLSGGTGIDVTGANATANQIGNTAWSVAIDSTVALKSDIPVIPSPVAPGDGEIKLTGGTGIDIAGANGTANQTGDSDQTISIDSTVALKSDIPAIPPAVVPGDGNITLTEGNGIKVSGADATANQTGDTAWTVKTDNDYLNTTLNFAKPDDIPTDLGVLTIENIEPHADGNFDFKSSDDALIVSPTAHGLSLSIDEDELDFVKEIKSGNELTLTVDEVDGIVTLTAAGGGGGGGAGNIAFAGGKCIDVVPDNNATTNVTTYTINNDLDCLNTSLGFATDQDITNAIGNIAIPEKTSELTNDGEDGINPFITAADIPEIPEAKLPIASEDGSIILGQAFTSERDSKSVVEGTQFVILINEKTALRLTDTGSLSLYGTTATTFFNKSTSLACYSKFESDRSACFVGTESYSPFVVKDSTGTTTLLQITSSLNLQASNNIITSTGKFQGQAWTTTTPVDGDPEIRMRNSPQQIEMAAGDTDLLFVHPLYVKSFVDIQTVGIAGRGAPATDARIDLGSEFVVSKGDGTERFSVDVQTGQIKQTTSAYTAFVINSSNASGAYIKATCGGGTYSFGASNHGWMVLDEGLNVLCQINDEVADFKGTVHTPSIAASDDEGSNAAIEFGSELLTSNYTPVSDNAIATVGYIQEVLSGGIGDDNSQLPGNGSNFIWQKVQIWQPSKIGNVNQTNVQRYYRVLAFDGIFTDGLHWTTDGEDWRTAAQSERNGLFTTANDGDRIVKSYAENLYVYGNYFSYNMKQWNTSFFGGYKDTFYFDGHVFSYAGGIYFDPTKPGAESTLALYGKSPTVPDGINGLGSKWGPSTGEPEGTVAFSLAESDTTRKNVLMLLRADETQDADWGWHQIDLPNGDEPLNVLYAPDKDSTPSFFVFCGQSVHVSPVSDPTNFTTYALPVASNWDLVCFDGTSITSASTSSDVSIFSSDGGETWDTSNNFYNLSTSVSQMALAGTNGRTIYSISTGESTATDEETGVETKYSITEYLRSGVGTIGDETIIIGGGSLVQTDGVSLTEPIDTSENNTASGFPTWRAAADADYDLAPEPALLKTQEETNSYFNNKISITRHDQNDLKEAVSGNTDEIAKNTGLASDAMNLAGAALATANSKTETVVLTQAEYDLLSPPDPMILYLIT